MPAASSITSSPSTNGRGRSTRTIVLKLPSGLLGRFPDSNAVEHKDSVHASTKEPSSPASTADPTAPASSADNASDAASNPPPHAASTEAPRRKGIPGPKPGSKRSLNQTGEVLPKPRGKPGPKKKPRLEDGSIDHSKVVPSAHKLGPKANQGAINAGLRALDRTGTPCRRWERKPFQLKSFTGVVWQIPTWRAPKPQKTEENGEAKEGATTVDTGDSDSKANASGVPSEKSNSGDGDLTPIPTNLTESPTPTIAMTA
ncbi:hypothetical protein VTN02DRAFT_630 [Thermoascus thermophilus]